MITALLLACSRNNDGRRSALGHAMALRYPPTDSFSHGAIMLRVSLVRNRHSLFLQAFMIRLQKLTGQYDQSTEVQLIKLRTIQMLKHRSHQSRQQDPYTIHSPFLFCATTR